MYAAGAPHPHKEPCANLMRRIASGEVEAVVDTEALQEILHRYRSIRRWDDGRRVYSLTRALFPRSASISESTLDRARDFMDRHKGLTARDAIHAAVAFEIGARAICSYDRDFDVVPEIRRIEPSQA